jgi:hypothetical protein
MTGSCEHHNEILSPVMEGGGGISRVDVPLLASR